MRRGSILIITLWALFMLTIFTVSIGYIVRQKMSLVGRLEARSELRYLVEAGIKRAIATVRQEDTTPDFDSLNERWSSNEGSFSSVSLGSGVFTVSYDYVEDGMLKVRHGLIDEERKINLNTADVETITRLLEAVGGLSLQTAARLAYSIIDWRDSDSMFQHPNYGAEDSDYRFMKRPYESKDAPFEIIEELLLVKGMTGETFGKIRDFITIYGDGTVNVNTAPREVFAALDMNEKLIKKILAFRKGDDLLEGTPDDNIFQNPQSITAHLSQVERMSASEVAELSNFVSKGVLTTRSSNFSVMSSAHLTTGSKYGMDAVSVINKDGEVLRWKEMESM